MPFAIRLREDNLDFIQEFGRQREMDLSSTVDNFYYNAADGFETILITDGTPENRNVTFTCMTAPGFAETWKFAEQENPNQFVKIERK